VNRSSGGREARAKYLLVGASLLVVAGAVLLGTTMSAFAAGTTMTARSTGSGSSATRLSITSNRSNWKWGRR